MFLRRFVSKDGLLNFVFLITVGLFGACMGYVLFVVLFIEGLCESDAVEKFFIFGGGMIGFVFFLPFFVSKEAVVFNEEENKVASLLKNSFWSLTGRYKGLKLLELPEKRLLTFSHDFESYNPWWRYEKIIFPPSTIDGLNKMLSNSTMQAYFSMGKFITWYLALKKDALILVRKKLYELDAITNYGEDKSDEAQKKLILAIDEIVKPVLEKYGASFME